MVFLAVVFHAWAHWPHFFRSQCRGVRWLHLRFQCARALSGSVEGGHLSIQHAPDILQVYKTFGYATLLPIAYMTFSVCSKRLHDFNWSSLWQCLPLALSATVYQVPNFFPAAMDGDVLQTAHHKLYVLSIQNDILFVAKIICYALLTMMCVRPGSRDGMKHNAGPEADLPTSPKPESAAGAVHAATAAPAPTRRELATGFGRRAAPPHRF